jgi:predicted transposase YbfD/YdcC
LDIGFPKEGAIMDGQYVARRLVERFEPITAHDPRVRRRQLHRLIDVVVLSVCGVLSGCESFTDVERYAKTKLPFFRQFLELPHGIPSHDTFSRIFARLSPGVFGECLRNWINDLRESAEDDHVAIDGKTLRGTFHKASEKSPLHSVSAWSTKYGLTLGQVATAAKSNEITAIPELIRLIDLEGAVVTIDAMGCQTDIAAEIQAAGADYVLALKDNHPTLAAEVQAAFEIHLESATAEQGPGYCHQRETAHGRTVERDVFVIPAPPTLHGRANWPGLVSLVMMITRRITGSEETGYVRYFLSTLPARARRHAQLIRNHWGIENNQHWVLDVTFREDGCRIYKDHGPENLALLNRLALSLIKQHTGKDSIRGKRKMCGWDDNFLLEILAGKPQN